MTFRRLIESPGGREIRIGERPKFIYGQKRNNQRSSPGIAGNTARLFEMRAPPTKPARRTRERQLYFKRNAARIPQDVPPRMF